MAALIANFVGGAVTAMHAIAEAIDSSNKIWIVLNNHTFVGGDVVTGTVEMDCLVPFTARGVLIKFWGYERTWFQTTRTDWEGEGQNRKAVERVVDHRQEREFFRQTIVVHPHSGVVTPGHYSFPFTYTLPANLPGTFSDKGNHMGRPYEALILYKAKATVDVAYRHNLHRTTRLVINEKFDQFVKPAYAQNSKSFMFTSGNLEARVWLDKNAYFPGETVLAKLKANNTSVKPTRKISIRVKHILRMHANGCSETIVHSDHKAEYPGFEPCFLGVRWMPFHIPVGKILPSSNGQLINSSYIFEIECDIPGAMDLQVELPILAPQFLWSTTPPTPANAPLPPNIQIRPPWQPDEARDQCNTCDTKFGFFQSRCHCRHCGKLFCKKCSATEIPIPKLRFKDNVRVCKACVPIVKSTGGVKYQSTKQIIAAWQATVPQVYASPALPQAQYASPALPQAQYASPTLPHAQYASPALPPVQYASPQPPQAQYASPPSPQGAYASPPPPGQYASPPPPHGQYPSPVQPHYAPQPQYTPQQAQYPPQSQPQYPPQGQSQYSPQQVHAPYPQQGQPQYLPQGVQPQYSPQQGQPQYPPQQPQQGQSQYPQQPQQGQAVPQPPPQSQEDDLKKPQNSPQPSQPAPQPQLPTSQQEDVLKPQ